MVLISNTYYGALAFESDSFDPLDDAEPRPQTG